jgi:nucleoside-diphosphate-sugar epimerase
VTRKLRVYVIGAGKVGTALSRALRARGVTVTLRAARKGAPRGPIGTDLLILAVRDGQLEGLIRDLLEQGSVDQRTAVVHCAGALGPESRAPVRDV